MAGNEERGGDTIRAVSRALDLLRVLNRKPIWTLHDLHAATGLPKATLSRLLRTLTADGYVRAEEPAGTYRLAGKVRQLSAGYTESSRLVEAGRRIALQVTKRIKWPLALGTPDVDAIVVRFSTMPYSPLAVHTTTLGHRLGLVESAMGRVYLAFAAEVERETLLANIAGHLSDEERESLSDVRSELARVRRAGYAMRRPSAQRTSATLAVPVLIDGASVAALSMTTFGKSMTRDIVDRHLPVLRETADLIAGAMAEDSA
jgi:IclR family mhp operon transcriptional activator